MNTRDLVIALAVVGVIALSGLFGVILALVVIA